MTDTTHSEATQKMWSMMKDIGFAMMTTEDGDHLRARPMVAAQKDFDGSLWFYTRASSHKVDEVQGRPARRRDLCRPVQAGLCQLVRPCPPGA